MKVGMVASPLCIQSLTTFNDTKVLWILICDIESQYIKHPPSLPLSLALSFSLPPSFSVGYLQLYSYFSSSSCSCSNDTDRVLQQPSTSTSGDDNESLPCTSYPCQWKQPKKRKESSLRMGDAVSEKHVLGRECKRKVEPWKILIPAHKSTGVR